MIPQPRVTKAWWMSARISQRIRSRMEPAQKCEGRFDDPPLAGVYVSDRVRRAAEEYAARTLRLALHRRSVVTAVLATWPADSRRRTEAEWAALRTVLPAGVSGAEIRNRTRLLGFGTVVDTNDLSKAVFTNRLQQLETRRGAEAECAPGYADKTRLCTISRVPNAMACVGDSGGPQIQRGRGGRWELIGTTSGPGAPSLNCASGPGLYSSVPAYAGWNRKTIGTNGCHRAAGPTDTRAVQELQATQNLLTASRITMSCVGGRVGTDQELQFGVTRVDTPWSDDELGPHPLGAARDLQGAWSYPAENSRQGLRGAVARGCCDAAQVPGSPEQVIDRMMPS